MNQQHEINILKNVIEKATGLSERLIQWAEHAINEIKKEIAAECANTENHCGQDGEPVPTSAPTPKPTQEPAPQPTPEPTPAPTAEPQQAPEQVSAASPAQASAAPDGVAPASQGSDG